MGVVVDEDGEAIIHVMPARDKFFEGMVEAMTTRAEKAAALERWAEEVSAEDLKVVDTSVLQTLGELAEQRAALEHAVAEAVRRARAANRTWSEIGAMLGVSKQAVQRKYGSTSSAA